MSKRLYIFLIIFSSPFLIMGIINECFDTPDRTHKFVEDYCTWYCHDVTCLHWKNDYRQNPSKLKRMHRDIFDWYVTSLHNNGLGLNYGSINLLVFIIGYPVIGALLLWNLIRKM